MSLTSVGVLYRLVAHDGASRTLDRVGRNASVLERSLGRLGHAAKLAGGALAGGLALALGESVKKAVDFQAEMTRISTQAGATTKDVQVLSKSVLGLGGTVQQGPQELADSLYHLKSVGMGNAQAMKALKQASDLAAVGHANLEETTNALAGAWRTGIKGATSFHEAVSTVNAIIGAGNMRMEDFNAAIGTGILPSAKTFGLSMRQVGAALALMTDEGIDSASAATRLRMSFSLLGAPSGAAEDQLKKIHLTGLQLAEAMRGKDGLIGALTLLKEHLDQSGMSASRQSQILSRAFGGGRSSSGILMMLNNLDVLQKKQDQINRSLGRFDSAVVTQRKTAQAQLALLQSTLETTGIKLGTVLLPPINAFVKFLNTTAIPAVGKTSRAFMSVIPVARIKTDISNATRDVRDFFSGLSGKSATVRVPFSVQHTGTSLSPVKPLSGSAKLGEQLRNAVGGAITGLDANKLGSLLGKALGKAVTWLASHIGELGKKLGAAIGKIDWVSVGKTVGGNALGFVIGFISNLGAELFSATFWKKHWWDVIVAVISVAGVGKLAGALEKVFAHVPILRAIAPMLRNIDHVTGPIQRAVGGVMKFFGKGFKDGFAKVFPKAAGAMEREIPLLPTRLGVWGLRMQEAGQRLTLALGKGILKLSYKAIVAINQLFFLLLKESLKLSGKAAMWLTRKGGELIMGLLRGIGRAAAGIGGWLYDHAISPVLHAFSSAGSWLWTKGGQLISGLKNGIVSAAKGIGGWMKSNLVDPVVDSVKHFFGIHSPSRVFHGIGLNLVAGLFKGLATHDGAAVAKRIFGSLPSALGSIVSKGLVSITSLPGRALQALGGLGGDILGLLGGSGGGGDAGNERIGRRMMLAMGWPAGQWSALRALWMGESGWRATALNRSSGAYGIPQALPASKMASAGEDWRSNPVTQIKWGLGYIKSRYGSPAAAYAAWQSRSPHWYARGSGGAAPGWAWVGERGPELINLKGGETILSHPHSMAVAQTTGMRLPGYASGTIDNAADRVRRAQQRVEDARDRLAAAERRRKGIRAAETQLKAAQTALKAAQIQLANARRTAKISVANTIANGLLKRLETGSSSAIASALKSLTTKLLGAGYDRLAQSVLKRGDRLEYLADKRAAVRTRIKTARQYAADQASTISDYLSISGTSATSVSDLLSQMKGSQKTARGFADLTTSLRARGASKALLAQLSQAGVGSQLATLLSDRNLTTEQIGQLNKALASGGRLATSFGNTMADAMYDSGSQAGKGFLAGLKAQEKQLQAEMNKLAGGMVDTIKKALKIKSPSVVMRDEVGWQVGAGLVAGMDAHRPHVAAAARRMSDTARGMKVANTASVATTAEAGTGQAAPVVVDVHVHFDDERLRDLIDVRVEPKIRASEQRQAFRAKVGRR